MTIRATPMSAAMAAHSVAAPANVNTTNRVPDAEREHHLLSIDTQGAARVPDEPRQLCEPATSTSLPETEELPELPERGGFGASAPATAALTASCGKPLRASSRVNSQSRRVQPRRPARQSS